MSHKFDYKNHDKLDNPMRRAVMPPEATLRRLGLQAGDRMADIGCGTGYFTLPAAAIVGGKGTVYALDISPEMIAAIEERAASVMENNIIPILVGENEFKLDDGAVNFAFICYVLHEAADINAFINEVIRITAANGKIVVIDWEKRETPEGPPLHHRLAKEEVQALQALMEKHGLCDTSIVALSDEQYAITCTKQ